MCMSFLVNGRPTLTAMLKSKNTEDLLREIEEIHIQGPDAFGFQIEMLNPDERCEKNYRKIISAMGDKPCYITNYCRGNVIEHTDEELTEELIMSIDCGAKLIDIRGDLFDRNPIEYTTDEKAVEKQMKVIEKIHSLGAEVIMSSHVLKYIPCDEVFGIASAHKLRGADIAKVVTRADNMDELNDNLKTSVMLKEKLGIPSLFLCNGTHCRRHRILGPVLGSDMFLVVHNSRENMDQPTIKRAKEQLILAGFEM